MQWSCAELLGHGRVTVYLDSPTCTITADPRVTRAVIDALSALPAEAPPGPATPTDGGAAR